MAKKTKEEVVVEDDLKTSFQIFPDYRLFV